MLLTHVGIQREWDRQDVLKMTLDCVLSVVVELGRCDLPCILDFSSVEIEERVH